MPKKKKKKKKKKDVYPWDRTEKSFPSKEYQFIDELNRSLGPSDPGTPPALRRMSEWPDLTIGWLRMNCKFAKGTNDADDDAGRSLPSDGNEVRQD
jgi:hypothetical protein